MRGHSGGMRRMVVVLGGVLTAFLAIGGVAESREFKGVAFPDSIVIGTSQCDLNGIGVRKKMMLEVYYGALYLKTPQRDAQQVINLEEPKGVLISVVYKAVDADKWQEGWREGFSHTAATPSPELKKKIDQFISFFQEPVLKGEEVRILYDPSRGTEVSIKGKVRGVIEGSDFMRALWGIWFGEKPASAELRAGMLGEK